MEKYKKKQLLEMTGLLKKINDFMYYVSGNDQNSILNALMQCQEIAVSMGSYLETKGTEGTRIAGILEEYCENLYQQSVSLTDDGQCRGLAEKIQKQLSTVWNSISYELPEEKKEMVFFPYKASMWDSLESIWRAAREDGEYDVYVVPVPYFDKNEDGTLREMHYEGNEYPDDVQIISWQEYNLAEHRPDVIFIHNPYDNNNLVTSVHPDYYAQELKKYTDMLVYVPYFMLQEIDVNNEQAIEKMRHFCFLPGIVYADKVIVQSENMRQIYIKEYLKVAESHNLPINRAELEKKILGLGSPKSDKVMNLSKENIVIPDEWKCIIDRADGTERKVVLYNTTLSALLQNGEGALKKIVYVINTFEMIEDIVLLWRPHPLYMSTIRSIRPELYGKYEKIVEKYKTRKCGIYDDTADLGRAIAISDAYYGDQSSVVQLYEKTGKPIMFADYSII